MIAPTAPEPQRRYLEIARAVLDGDDTEVCVWCGECYLLRDLLTIPDTVILLCAECMRRYEGVDE